MTGLVLHYAALQPYRVKSLWHVRLLDLEVAVAALAPALRDAVFYVGMMRLPLRQAAEHLNVSRTTLWRRYQLGLGDLVRHMNGEAYEG